jgi:hypothetical protein
LPAGDQSRWLHVCHNSITYYQLASHLCVSLAVCAGCCTHLLHPCTSRHKPAPEVAQAVTCFAVGAVSSLPDSAVAVGQRSTSRNWEPHRHTEHSSRLLAALRQRCAVIVQDPSPSWLLSDACVAYTAAAAAAAALRGWPKAHYRSEVHTGGRLFCKRDQGSHFVTN